MIFHSVRRLKRIKCGRKLYQLRTTLANVRMPIRGVLGSDTQLGFRTTQFSRLHDKQRDNYNCGTAALMNAQDLPSLCRYIKQLHSDSICSIFDIDLRHVMVIIIVLRILKENPIYFSIGSNNYNQFSDVIFFRASSAIAISRNELRVVANNTENVQNASVISGFFQ